MAMFAVLIFTALASWLVWMYFHFRETVYMILATRRAAEQFSYIKPHWLLGNLNQEKDSIGFFRLMQGLAEKYNRKFVFWASSLRPVLVVVHPETAKAILKTTEPKTYSLGIGYSLLYDWIGDGLLLSSGKKWERNRKLLTPAFHFAILKPYVNEYNKATQLFLRKIENESKQNEFIEVTMPIGLLTLDVMLRCAFSHEGRVQEEGITHPYVVAVHALSELIFRRIINPLCWMKTVYSWTSNGKKWKKTCDYVHDFSREIIEKRKIALEEDPDILKNRHLDFLDILLTAKDECGEGLTGDEIRDEVDTFLFEGHDTTASSASWIMYALAKYPDIQAKVCTEIQDVLGTRTEVKWEDLAKLNYTQLVIKETLRMYSPVFVISRQTTKESEIDGCKIPAGMHIDINIMCINHNPSVWEDHQVFDPLRFAADDFSERDPYKFVPFSAGPRNCIGQNFAMNELKTIVALTLQRFRVELDPDHEVVFLPALVMRAEKGIKLKFLAR